MENKTCTIKLIDEINAVLIGLKREEYEMLYDEFAKFAKGYRFHPKFKLGRWDGKIGFVNKNGKTYVYLLKEIIPIIKKWGYKITLIDKRNYAEIDIPLIDENYLKDYGIILGPHQVDAINSILKHNHGIVEASVGSGKTFINAILCDLYNKHCNFKTITIVPTIDLVTQTLSDFKKFNLDAGEYSGTCKDLNHDHIIATWQSIQNNPAIMAHFRVVVADEAHTVTGKSLQSILNENGSHIMVRIGMTGTIPIDECNAMTVFVTLGPRRYVIKSAELIENGWLAELMINIFILDESLLKEWETYKIKNPHEWKNVTYKEFMDSIFPTYPAERAYLENKNERNQFIADLVNMKRSNKKGNCLILVNSVKQGNKLQELIPNSYFITGSDHKKIRKEIFSLFDEGNDICTIATFKLASTGLNIPRIFYLFLVDSGRGFEKIVQSIGRGLRKAKDKESVQVYDIASTLKFSKAQLRERIKHYNSQKYNYKKKSIDYQ